MDKKTVNVLYNWETYGEQGSLRVRGQVALDHPSAHAARGDCVITSPIVRMYRSDEGARMLETKNSLYVLVENDPIASL